MPGDKTYFNVDWTNPEINPNWCNWLAPIKDLPNSAFCTKCCKKFSLSNMGMQAVRSHEQGKVHQKIIRNEKFQGTVKNMFKKVTEIDTDKSEKSSIIQNSSLMSSKIQTLDEVLIKKETTIAEIIWALRIIMKKESFNSSKDDGFLFKKMFTDSAIAKNFSMGPDKASYLINYGLAPHFSSLLQKQLLQCKEYVVCFDEALNQIAQKSQMDIHVRFWCNIKKQVCTRYLNSAFLTRSCAENLLKNFKEALSPFSLDKLLQLSMDGPAVNWKFLKLLKSDLELGESGDSELLDIGSCGLHSIHGAFQTGHNKAGWQANQFLRALYNLFKDSPARRAEYTRISGSNTFPKKFCQTRWLENADCAERAILIFENIKKFFDKKPNLPEISSVRTVQNCINNSLMLPQLAFFRMLSNELNCFLLNFQSSKPLSPFLYVTLLELTQNLLKRFVKKDIVDNATTAKKLAEIDLNNSDNLLTFHNVNIGFSATKYLSKSKASEKEKGLFKMDCRNFLIATVSKILERSPLKYNLTRGISSLMPDLIVKKPNIAQQRMDVCLKILHENNRLSDVTAESAKKEFYVFCEYYQKEKEQHFLDFVPSSEQRLDSFFSELLEGVKKFEKFFMVVKMILIMSHGNATVESGFSINKSLLLENLNEESIVSQRCVYDYVMSCGGIKEVDIDNKTVLAVKGSRTRWSAALEAKRIKMAEVEKVALSKKRQFKKIKELKAKKLKLSKATAAEIDLLNSEIIKEEHILENMSII